jgi:tetratricopeptide (TPR) repeat protein
MKKVNVYIIMIFLLASFSMIIAKEDKLELGIRNLKLGNTYRESGNYDFAARFLNDGINAVSKYQGFKAQYWTAAGYEYLGYLYRDMNIPDEAKKHLDKAAQLYRKIIIQEDGSPQAMAEILNKLSNSLDSKPNVNKTDGEVLNLSSSKLRKLPDGISKSTKNLILKDNKFRDFPEIITSLKDLEYLDLSGNKIKEIPESIENLKKLHCFNLANNKITKIPESISELKDLKELNLENNKIKDIPQSITELKGLRILNLKGNKLKLESVLNLVRSLPNTNIIFDEYIKKPVEEVIAGEEE